MLAKRGAAKVYSIASKTEKLSPLKQSLADSKKLETVRWVGKVTIVATLAPCGLFIALAMFLHRYFGPEKRAERTERQFQEIRDKGLSAELGFEHQV